MNAVWDLLQYLSDTISTLQTFCPVQFLPSGAAQVFEIEGERYRVLKEVCCSSWLT
jgi:hypothetical protein